MIYLILNQLTVNVDIESYTYFFLWYLWSAIVSSMLQLFIFDTELIHVLVEMITQSFNVKLMCTLNIVR